MDKIERINRLVAASEAYDAKGDSENAAKALREAHRLVEAQGYPMTPNKTNKMIDTMQGAAAERAEQQKASEQQKLQGKARQQPQQYAWSVVNQTVAQDKGLADAKRALAAAKSALEKAQFDAANRALKRVNDHFNNIGLQRTQVEQIMKSMYNQVLSNQGYKKF
jgi:hypothetical protein